MQDLRTGEMLPINEEIFDLIRGKAAFKVGERISLRGALFEVESIDGDGMRLRGVPTPGNEKDAIEENLRRLEVREQRMGPRVGWDQGKARG